MKLLRNTTRDFGVGQNVMNGLQALGAISIPFQIHSMTVADPVVRKQEKLQRETLKRMRLLKQQQTQSEFKFWQGLEKFNNITMLPAIAAPFFIADATTRKQKKLAKQLEENPNLAKAMGQARAAAENEVKTANPNPNRILPQPLAPNSLVGL